MVQGRSQYAPKSKKDMMWTLKASHRMRELEKEEVQMMYRPQMVPKYNKIQPVEDPDKDDIEEEEEEEEIEPVVHARSSRNSRRKWAEGPITFNKGCPLFFLLHFFS